jgi:hypothetical protein
VRARPIRARDDQCGARACFPSSDVSGGEGKKPFRCFDRADAGSSGVFATRAFWICARVPSRQPNPQSGVNFFLSSPTLGGETETPHETREPTKRARRIFRVCQLVPQGRTIFRETSNYRAREWTLFATRERRVPDRETRRTRVRVARRRKHPREGAHFGRVRSNAARAESQPTRFRRCSFFLLSRRPAFRGNRHPATRPGGGRDEGSETRSVARDSDARALTDHTPALTLTAPTHRDEAARPWTERART